MTYSDDGLSQVGWEFDFEFGFQVFAGGTHGYPRILSHLPNFSFGRWSTGIDHGHT
jgi:hypothetical protein